MHPFRLPAKSVVNNYGNLYTKFNYSKPIGTTNVIYEPFALKNVINLCNFVYSCSKTSGSGELGSSFVSTNPTKYNLCCKHIDNICSVHSKYCQKIIYKNLTKSTKNTSEKEDLLETQDLLLEDNGILGTNQVCNKVGTHQFFFYFTFHTWSFLENIYK